MKVKILKRCFIGTGGNALAGETHELVDRMAENLIAGGFAVKVGAKKKTAPKTNRAVETLETPESE